MHSTEAVNYVLNKLSDTADWEDAVNKLDEIMKPAVPVNLAPEEKPEEIKEDEYMSGISDVADKININMPGGDGAGMGGLGLMAALNQGNNSNQWLPLLVLLGLARGGNGGLLGGNGDNVSPAVDLGVIIQALGDLKASVPTTALETQNAIQQALFTLSGQQQAGFANLGDKVTNASTVNLVATKDVGTQVQTSALSTQIAINTDGERTRALVLAGIERANAINEANLNRELAVAQAQLASQHSARHAESLSVQVTNNLTNQQAQFQRQLQDDARIARLESLIQHANNSIVAVGSTLLGTGQSNANTSVS